MLATNPAFLQWIINVKSNVDSGQFKPMLKAAIKALQANEDWYTHMNQVYSKRRTVAEKILNQLNCSWDPKQSGLFLWGRIPDNMKDAGTLADRVLYDANVFITPGFIFGSNGNRYVRLSLCCTEEKLREALQRIQTL
jgi:aspartate/methionine/tyrosine aminotransferase